MGNVIFASEHKVDINETTIAFADSQADIGDDTVLLDLDKVSLVGLEGHSIYIPATLINSFQVGNVNVYHELENYPFFQKAKEIILRDGVPKGVFRLQRVMDGVKNTAHIASDLCVLSSVFGELEKVVVKHSRSEVEPQHVIVMIGFGGGTMAHVDYTFSNREYVELEWSGIGRIIEFNSEEMNPMKPNSMIRLALQYKVDSIIENSKSIASVKKEFHRFQQLVGGVEA